MVRIHKPLPSNFFSLSQRAEVGESRFACLGRRSWGAQGAEDSSPYYFNLFLDAATQAQHDGVW